MAREDLIPMNERTEEEQKAIARAGGKASVKARRRKKTLQALTRAAMAAPLNELGEIQTAKRSGLDLSALDPEDMTAALGVVVGQIRAAMAGDPRAARVLADWLDLDTDRKRKKLETELTAVELQQTKTGAADDDMVMAFIAGISRRPAEDPRELPEPEQDPVREPLPVAESPEPEALPDQGEELPQAGELPELTEPRELQPEPVAIRSEGLQ